MLFFFNFIIHSFHSIISSRDEIFKFLSSMESSELMSKEKLKELLELVSATELRHIDFLIYLMGYYRFAAPFVLKVIIEVLQEDERILQNLLQNIGVDRSALPS